MRFSLNITLVIAAIDVSMLVRPAKVLMSFHEYTYKQDCEYNNHGYEYALCGHS